MVGPTSKMIAAVLAFVASSTALAKARLADRFFTFELPSSTWQCQTTPPVGDNPSQATHACRDRRGGTATMVFRAVRREPGDGFGLYLARLRRPRPIVRPNGTPGFSEVRYVRNVTIEQHSWADAVHYESESPHSLTRYLMAVTANFRYTVTITVPARPTDSWAGASQRVSPGIADSIRSVKIHETPQH